MYDIPTVSCSPLYAYMPARMRLYAALKGVRNRFSCTCLTATQGAVYIPIICDCKYSGSMQVRGCSLQVHPTSVLCNCVQFVYDTWYSTLTPDREFPREVRRILNTAFGELAGRARRADVKKMLLG